MTASHRGEDPRSPNQAHTLHPCEICRSVRVRELGSPGGVPVRLCRDCRSLSSADALNMPDDLYDDHYFGSSYLRFWDERTHFLERLLGRLGPPGPLPLLDCGCGAGLAVEVASRAGWVAVGVEPSRAGARMTLERGNQVVRGKAESLPVPRGAFGGAIVLDVLAHVEYPARVLREVVTALAPGSRVMVKTPHRPSWVYRLAGALPVGVARSLLHLPHQRHAISRKGLATMMHGAGLQDVAVTGIGEAVPRWRRIAGGWKSRMANLFKLLVESFYGRPSSLALGTAGGGRRHEDGEADS